MDSRDVAKPRHVGDGHLRAEGSAEHRHWTFWGGSTRGSGPSHVGYLAHIPGKVQHSRRAALPVGTQRRRLQWEMTMDVPDPNARRIAMPCGQQCPGRH